MKPSQRRLITLHSGLNDIKSIIGTVEAIFHKRVVTVSLCNKLIVIQQVHKSRLLTHLRYGLIPLSVASSYSLRFAGIHSQKPFDRNYVTLFAFNIWMPISWFMSLFILVIF